MHLIGAGSQLFSCLKFGHTTVFLQYIECEDTATTFLRFQTLLITARFTTTFVELHDTKLPSQYTHQCTHIPITPVTNRPRSSSPIPSSPGATQVPDNEGISHPSPPTQPAQTPLSETSSSHPTQPAQTPLSETSPSPPLSIPSLPRHPPPAPYQAPTAEASSQSPVAAIRDRRTTS